MKQNLLLSLTCVVFSTFAQPVIQDSSYIPKPGFSATVSTATASGVGNAGADQTWDFSALTYSNAGTMSVILPSSAPIGSSFPNATYAYSFANTYSFFRASDSVFEVLAYTIVTAGQGNDYSPNPRTNLKFPFSYMESISDGWAKVGSSLNNVIVSYDAYGTLKIPGKTYTNVVRIKEDYGSGSVDYQWYTLNPLTPVAIYNHNTNTIYAFNLTQVGISDNQISQPIVQVYPNPCKTEFNLQVSGLDLSQNTTLGIMNALGQTIAEYAIIDNLSPLECKNLPSGIYFYQLKNENGVLKVGQLLIE